MDYDRKKFEQLVAECHRANAQASKCAVAYAAATDALAAASEDENRARKALNLFVHQLASGACDD